MAGITLRTARQVVPMIYAYTTPEIARHNGWTKIGYTEQSVDKRLKQQTHTADVLYHEEWRGNAVYDDGSGEVFTDHDFHAYLRKLNVENDRKNEWFHLDGQQSRRYFQDFRMNRGRVQLDAAIAYTLREEQARAVRDTKTYYQSHPGGEYLWNAKPRFGKTLSVYDFCKQVDAQTVLIVTNRPAIANSWHSDYVRFLGRESGYLFVSHVDALAGQPHVLDEQSYLDAAAQGEELYKRIEFVSLQDMKGSKYFGGEYDKLRHLTELNWDVLVIDEAHEGVDTYKTDLAFDRIRRKFTLHLSGTPFKALANDKFAGDAIFNWTYADEQAAKRNWQGAPGQQNPYANLPMLNLYTYQMSEIIRNEIQHGVEIDGETQEFAFDLNEFFKVKPNGSFEHDAEVDRFLDAMTTQNKFPFSTPELRAELKHTFWLLNRVDSARALAKKLQAHPVFRDYEVILAAGDGKLDDTDENQKSFDRVKAAIAHHEKTITLSVGQLTTGVTIPEWSAVLMLSNLKSPALYMQAAFRAQNPCLFHENGTFRRKENAYVFDFDPARTLLIYEQFANDLIGQVLAGMEVELPDAMVDYRAEQMVQDYAQRITSQGIPFEKYLEMTGQTMDRMKEQAKESAIKQIKYEMAMDAVAAAEGIVISDEELDAEYQSLADQYKMELDQVKALASAEDVRTTLLRRKAIDVVKDSAKVGKAKKPAAKKAAKETEDETAEEKPKKKATSKKKAETEQAPKTEE